MCAYVYDCMTYMYTYCIKTVCEQLSAESLNTGVIMESIRDHIDTYTDAFDSDTSTQHWTKATDMRINTNADVSTTWPFVLHMFYTCSYICNLAKNKLCVLHMF